MRCWRKKPSLTTNNGCRQALREKSRRALFYDRISLLGRPIIDSGVMPVTVVYVDRVLLLNLAVDYLLLMTTATLAGTPLRRLRFGICAAFGGGYAVCVFLLPLLAHPLCRVGVGTAMALWAFRREVRPWRMTALFLAVVRRTCGAAAGTGAVGRLTDGCPAAGLLCRHQLAGAAGRGSRLLWPAAPAVSTERTP